MSEQRTTIRFEDLGAPIQKLLRSLKGGVAPDGSVKAISDADMSLLEYISVKDMAKIYTELGTDRAAEQIWLELKAALQDRKEKQERKRAEKEGQLKEYERQQALAAEEAARIAAEEEEEKRKRKEERRKRKEEQAQREAEEAARIAEEEAAEAEAARLAAEEAAGAAEEAERKAERKRKKAEAKARREAEEAERAAEEERLRLENEERMRKEEKRRKKAEEKLRKIEEEQATLQEELRAEKAARKTGKKMKDEWNDYVKSHPLEFANAEEEQEITQKVVERVNFKAPPSATAELLNRVYTPKCPSCGAKYAKPPNEWDCPICSRRLQMKVKCWQPDEEASGCAICKVSVGRFSRHHCRNCGRVVCGDCGKCKAVIPALGFKDPVKVCTDCFAIPTSEAQDSPKK